jgi:hypothetical protein
MILTFQIPVGAICYKFNPFFSLVEYPCIIEVILKPISKGKKGECCKESDTDSGDELQSSTLHKTKVRNTLFPFQRYHPLAKTHVQRIRLKLYIVKNIILMIAI